MNSEQLLDEILRILNHPKVNKTTKARLLRVLNKFATENFHEGQDFEKDHYNS